MLADAIHPFGDIRQWQEGEGVEHTAEMPSVVVVFVRHCQTELLHLPQRTLRQMLKQPWTLMWLPGTTVAALIAACSKRQTPVIGSTLYVRHSVTLFDDVSFAICPTAKHTHGIQLMYRVEHGRRTAAATGKATLKSCRP